MFVSENLSIRFHNILEPSYLVRQFLLSPPEGFSSFCLSGGVPAFAMPFDLLTTIDDVLRKKIDKLPIMRMLNRWRHPLTCFVGTTVSEYALLPRETSPEHFVLELCDKVTPHYPFLIIKDIPNESVLVGMHAFQYASHLADVCKKK